MPKNILNPLHYWQNLGEADIYNGGDHHPFHVAAGSWQSAGGQLNRYEDILAHSSPWLEIFASIPEAFWKDNWSHMTVFETHLLYRFFWFPVAGKKKKKKGILLIFFFSLFLPPSLTHISWYKVLFPEGYVVLLLHQNRGNVLVLLRVLEIPHDLSKISRQGEIFSCAELVGLLELPLGFFEAQCFTYFLPHMGNLYSGLFNILGTWENVMGFFFLISLARHILVILGVDPL